MSFKLSSIQWTSVVNVTCVNCPNLTCKWADWFLNPFRYGLISNVFLQMTEQSHYMQIFIVLMWVFTTAFWTMAFFEVCARQISQKWGLGDFYDDLRINRRLYLCPNRQNLRRNWMAGHTGVQPQSRRLLPACAIGSKWEPASPIWGLTFTTVTPLHFRSRSTSLTTPHISPSIVILSGHFVLFSKGPYGMRLILYLFSIYLVINLLATSSCYAMLSSDRHLGG